MRIRETLTLAATAVVAGCSVLPKAPAETYYDLKYDPDPVQCARSYSSPVEVWTFTAVGPYERTQMVVTDGSEVSFSRGHQWVDHPGALVAGHLMRDLSTGNLFPVAVSPRDPVGAQLALTGTLYRFAWAKEGGSARASLEADVVLRRTGTGAGILLHERYEVQSEPLAATDDASAFTRAMSGVVSRFSLRLRRDLCAALLSSTSSTERSRSRRMPAPRKRRLLGGRGRARHACSGRGAPAGGASWRSPAGT